MNAVAAGAGQAGRVGQDGRQMPGRVARPEDPVRRRPESDHVVDERARVEPGADRLSGEAEREPIENPLVGEIQPVALAGADDQHAGHGAVRRAVHRPYCDGPGTPPPPRRRAAVVSPTRLGGARERLELAALVIGRECVPEHRRRKTALGADREPFQIDVAGGLVDPAGRAPPRSRAGATSSSRGRARPSCRRARRAAAGTSPTARRRTRAAAGRRSRRGRPAARSARSRPRRASGWPGCRGTGGSRR